jgi:hypothetical protein
LAELKAILESMFLFCFGLFFSLLFLLM